jgi:phage/plasmid-like protein (TIGR03299 family)
MKTRNEKIFDLLYNNGLDWEANKLPLIAQVKEDSEVNKDTSFVRTLHTNSYGVFRSDNKEHLGTVGERYEIFQNSELAGTLVDACDGLDLEVKRGGTLKGGKKVFLQIVLPETTIGNSGIMRYLTAMNSHDGSSSIGFGTTNTVIVCTNTFHKAMSDVQSIRHTISYSQRIKEAVESIKMAVVGENQLMDEFKRMADIKIEDDKYVVDLVSKIFKADKDSVGSTRKVNQVTQMAQDIRKDIGIHGNNLWGLFNGITRYTNHSAVQADKALESVMVGTGQKMNDLAYKEIMKQVYKSLEKTMVQV